MFKALLLSNYINEQIQFFRDASNFVKYCKNNIIYIVTYKSQRSWTPKPEFLVLATYFRKISNLTTVLFFDIFCSFLKTTKLLINPLFG